jgi:hypothetical protein
MNFREKINNGFAKVADKFHAPLLSMPFLILEPKIKKALEEQGWKMTFENPFGKEFQAAVAGKSFKETCRNALGPLVFRGPDNKKYFPWEKELTDALRNARKSAFEPTGMQ